MAQVILVPRTLVLGETLIVDIYDKLSFGAFETWKEKTYSFTLQYDPEKTGITRVRIHLWAKKEAHSPSVVGPAMDLDVQPVGGVGWVGCEVGERAFEKDWPPEKMTPGTHTIKISASTSPFHFGFTIDFWLRIWVTFSGEEPESEIEKPPIMKAADYLKWALVIGGIGLGGAVTVKIWKAIRGT